MKFIDLTREINNNTQVCPCDKVPVVEDYDTMEEEGVNVKFMKMGTYTSTHIDAPYHISKEGRNLNDFPVERFIGKGIVLDFSDRGEIYEITREDIMAHAEELRQVDFAILNTGWASYYGTWDFFRHPYLSGDAALALVELGIKIVGTDGSSADAAYGFACVDGWFPKKLGKINDKYGTPHYLLILFYIVGLIPVVAGLDIDRIANMSMMLMNITTFLVVVATARLPKLLPDAWAKSTFKISNVALKVICYLCGALLVFQNYLLIEDNTPEIIIGNIILLVLTFIFMVLRYKSGKVKVEVSWEEE